MKAGTLSEVEDFTGPGLKKPLEVADYLSEQYGGNPEDWMHSRGVGIVVDKKGKERTAEIHWFTKKETGEQCGWKWKKYLRKGKADESSL